MAHDRETQPDAPDSATADLPDRMCRWCKVAMMKRLVAAGQFIHYTCPKCVFQHTSKRTADLPSDAQ